MKVSLSIKRPEDRERINTALASQKGAFTIEEFARLAMLRLADEIEEQGCLHSPRPTRAFEGKAVPLIPDKVLRRLCELDTLLEFEPGDGYAELILESALSEIISDASNDRKPTMLFDQWIFDNEEDVYNDLKSLVAKWRAEDGEGDASNG